MPSKAVRRPRRRDGEGRFEELEKTLVPIFEKSGPNLRLPGLVDMDLGQAVAQATLMAIEQGLGICCQGSANWKKVEKAVRAEHETKGFDGRFANQCVFVRQKGFNDRKGREPNAIQLPQGLQLGVEIPEHQPVR